MKKSRSIRGSSTPTTQQNKRVLLILAAIVAVVLVLLIVLRSFWPSTSSSSRHGAAVPQAGMLGEDARRLIGNWVRTDTPYVIEIVDANDDGTLKAAYYNPRSINVAHAEARYMAGNLELFVELRDINYPGSTYTLTYDRANDILQGTYFQATMRETYQVVFARERSNP